jgi:hypothetical protein
MMMIMTMMIMMMMIMTMMVKMYFVLHVNTRYSCKNLMRLIFSTDFFKKYPNIKFHCIPFSGSRVVP